MKDEDKTKKQLIAELDELRKIIEEQELNKKDQTVIYQVPEPSSPDGLFSTDGWESFVSYNYEYKQRANKSKKYHISDLIDIPLFHQLMNAFYQLTGIPYAITDADYNILSGVGWQDICTKFHRVCLQTASRCDQSDRYVLDHIQDGPCIRYKCLNGLMEYGTPIFVEGQHLATIYTGQLFNEPPNEEYFRQQAQEFGFDEEAYIEALHKIKIVPEHQIKSIMQFTSKLGQILTSLGLERLRRIEAAEDKVLKAFHCNPDAMSITTLEEGRYLEVNNAFCRITGYSHEEIMGQSSLETGFWLDHADRYLVKQRLMANHSVRDMEIHFCKNTGEQGLGLYSAEILDVHGEPCMLSVVMDITELRQMEVEMNRLDRLNVVGEMAASIGHEIRNPMTTVRGYLQLLQQNEDYHQDIEYFDLMIEELDRANSIITEFLSLAKDKMVELKPTNLNSIIDKLLPLLRAKAISQDQHITLELDELPDLLLDTKEIRQLILNLVNNGMESMPSGGVVTIRTFKEKEKVVLAVQDRGHGIDSKLLNKLGTPFLTTKEQGTGLGLAVCYRITARHNAKIDIETSSMGTTLFVRFPSPIVTSAVS